MIEIKEVATCRQRREFLNFPNKLYKNNPCYAPALMMDERKIFRKDYLYYDTSEAVYYNAYKDGVMAGRISGILQRFARKGLAVIIRVSGPAHRETASVDPYQNRQLFSRGPGRSPHIQI